MNNLSAYVQDWLDAVCSHNLNAVMSKYAQNSILIATLAPTPLIGKSQIRPYFVEFLQNPELCGEINSAVVQVLSHSSFIVSGVYTFGYRENGRPTFIPARFSFVFVLENNHWKIANHHSSKVPSE